MTTYPVTALLNAGWQGAVVRFPDFRTDAVVALRRAACCGVIRVRLAQRWVDTPSLAWCDADPHTATTLTIVTPRGPWMTLTRGS